MRTISFFGFKCKQARALNDAQMVTTSCCSSDNKVERERHVDSSATAKPAANVVAAQTTVRRLERLLYYWPIDCNGPKAEVRFAPERTLKKSYKDLRALAC
jgi:hypothetical protein